MRQIFPPRRTEYSREEITAIVWGILHIARHRSEIEGVCKLTPTKRPHTYWIVFACIVRKVFSACGVCACFGFSLFFRFLSSSRVVAEFFVRLSRTRSCRFRASSSGEAGHNANTTRGLSHKKWKPQMSRWLFAQGKKSRFFSHRSQLNQPNMVG